VWRADALVWRDRGATHLSVNSMGRRLADPDAHIARILAARQVIDDLSS
jgi:hypothetical protein